MHVSTYLLAFHSVLVSIPATLRTWTTQTWTSRMRGNVTLWPLSTRPWHSWQLSASYYFWSPLIPKWPTILIRPTSSLRPSNNSETRIKSSSFRWLYSAVSSRPSCLVTTARRVFSFASDSPPTDVLIFIFYNCFYQRYSLSASLLEFALKEDDFALSPSTISNQSGTRKLSPSDADW